MASVRYWQLVNRFERDERDADGLPNPNLNPTPELAEDWASYRGVAGHARFVRDGHEFDGDVVEDLVQFFDVAADYLDIPRFDLLLVQESTIEIECCLLYIVAGVVNASGQFLLIDVAASLGG